MCCLDEANVRYFLVLLLLPSISFADSHLWLSLKQNKDIYMGNGYSIGATSVTSLNKLDITVGGNYSPNQEYMDENIFLNLEYPIYSRLSVFVGSMRDRYILNGCEPTNSFNYNAGMKVKIY